MKKTKKRDKIVLLAKPKLHEIEILICKAFIDSNVSHDEFVLRNNVLKEYDDIKEEIEKLQSLNSSSKILSLFIKQCYHNV